MGLRSIQGRDGEGRGEVNSPFGLYARGTSWVPWQPLDLGDGSAKDIPVCQPASLMGCYRDKIIKKEFSVNYQDLSLQNAFCSQALPFVCTDSAHQGAALFPAPLPGP